MQGTARMGQTLFTMQPGKPKTIRLSSTGKKVVYGGILLGTVQAMMLAAAGFDDDDPPEFLRERALILPTGWSGIGPDKGYISIPMPLGFHVIPGIGRHAAEFALSGFEKPQKRIVSMMGMFMDAFNPAHICNHTDSGGRYAYHRQPNIAYWNLFCLGQALLPLMDDQQQALDALEPFKTVFPAALQQRMGAKLGLAGVQTGDEALTEQFMQLMAKDAVDFTIAWRRLSHAVAGFAMPGATEADARRALEPVRDLFLQREAFDAWAQTWRTRLQSQSGFDPLATQARMLRTNPQVVLRNHLGEIAIQRAREGDFSRLQRLQAALEQPFDALPGCDDLADFPPEWAAQIEISCSS
jgi:hypothetical protein